MPPPASRLRMVSRGPIKGFLQGLAERLKYNERFRQWVYYSSRYPKLGMMTHDTLRMDKPIMKEARARLPKDLAAERQFRISRALYLDSKQQILPKEEWMTLAQDKPYMARYINPVELEMAEKRHYEKKIYKPFYKIQNLF